MKLSSIIKSILPSEKAVRRLPHFQNYLPISPKDMGDISGIVLPKVGGNGWSPNNVDYDYLQKMYDCHDLVHSCIDLVSSTFALAKLRVKKFDTKTQKYHYVPDHPLQILLDNPNNSMGGYDLRQAYIVHRLLFGTVGFILIRGHMTISNDEKNKCPECKRSQVDDCVHILWHFNTGPVTQIMPVHLDRLGKKKYKNREYFTYNWGNDIDMLIHPNNILTDPNYNPAGSFFGNSPTSTIQRWLEVDLGLTTQIGAYLVNNAIPSMILNLKPPKFGNENISSKFENPTVLLEKMKERWMKDFSMAGYNSNNQGGSKVKTPAFVYGDLEILKIQDSIKDIVQKPLFFQIENRIAMAYKVPRSFFEFGIENNVDPEKANKDFYNFAIAPQLESFIGKMERFLLPGYNDPTLKLEWDLSNMGIASFLEDKKKAQVLREWEVGLDTRDATREKLGMNPLGGDLGDDLYRIDVLGNNEDSRQLNPQNRGTQMDSTDNRLRTNPRTSREAGYDTDDI